jgi:ubiquinone/menaquinone biosynthesis C-methylase UbiE
MRPAAVLEVGCGQGAFAQALTARGLEVTAVDQSEHMVGVTAALGVTAQQADVQSLPFGDDTFDVVAANYMLYHVPDLPRALDEIVRVLRPGGALVAVTNSGRQLHELWSLVGRDASTAAERVFGSDNGAEILRRAFGQVEQLDIEEQIEITGQAARDYVQATRFGAISGEIPDFPSTLTVTAAGSVFIASNPA